MLLTFFLILINYYLLFIKKGKKEIEILLKNDKISMHYKIFIVSYRLLMASPVRSLTFIALYFMPSVWLVIQTILLLFSEHAFLLMHVPY